MTEYRHEHDWLSAPEPTLPPAMSELRITSCSDRITKRLYSQYMGWPRHNSSPDIITQCICCLWLMGLIIFKCWEEVIRWYKLDNVSASVTNATLLNIKLCHTHHLTLSQIFHEQWYFCIVNPRMFYWTLNGLIKWELKLNTFVFAVTMHLFNCSGHWALTCDLLTQLIFPEYTSNKTLIKFVDL